MAYYLPIDNAADRSHLEAMQRGAGLQAGDVTQYWQTWIIHPVTQQEALVLPDEESAALLTADELAALLTQEQAEQADWFLTFEDGA